MVGGLSLGLKRRTDGGVYGQIPRMSLGERVSSADVWAGICGVCFCVVTWARKKCDACMWERWYIGVAPASPVSHISTNVEPTCIPSPTTRRACGKRRGPLTWAPRGADPRANAETAASMLLCMHSTVAESEHVELWLIWRGRTSTGIFRTHGSEASRKKKKAVLKVHFMPTLILILQLFLFD